jgi:hypothetical protein
MFSSALCFIYVFIMLRIDGCVGMDVCCGAVWSGIF